MTIMGIAHEEVQVIDMVDVLAERVRSGAIIYVNGPVDEVQSRLRVALIIGLQRKTGASVDVMHLGQRGAVYGD